MKYDNLGSYVEHFDKLTEEEFLERQNNEKA